MGVQVHNFTSDGPLKAYVLTFIYYVGLISDTLVTLHNTEFVGVNQEDISYTSHLYALYQYSKTSL